MTKQIPTVYIVDQLEHGNGGVYNNETLACLSLNEALTKTPFNYGVRTKEWGFWPVISPTEDANDAIYEWDENDHKWEATSKLRPFLHPQPPCPECEKLAAVSEKSQELGSFLEWMFIDSKYVLCKWTEDDDEEDYRRVYVGDGKISEILAEFFHIDLDKVEKERRALLDWIREEQE